MIVAIAVSNPGKVCHQFWGLGSGVLAESGLISSGMVFTVD
jgi:hypothetical protein